MAIDVIGRPIEVDDFIYYYSYVYQVLSVTPFNVRAIIYPKSKTSAKRSIRGRECCLLPKEDVLMWILKNGKI